ncbi:hypothetical protein ASPVEDRAFT_78338 [Aspergillus versicolor CBS 583.65]|uniref:Uncharacterized protein n=1 Tax=Aspergillus versicolor CBS 583.65 TaxID=1036611 RepID=A0A1L9P4Z2_ASPVE|nr:uncharacterized protein ASPVEDRAFT_78338 [Aspergillus versicolor CBS 583.65]OJI96572.1 hypothetical protein ASPVEDRAFT_78338 [Aspergillus versicolor CBS 583.65]
MGQKISAVHGVKSDDFTQPGNAVNEIWVGDTEVISRLPFGDNDIEQAGWPKDGMPKIPWHNFIIPMKRGIIAPPRYNHSFYLNGIYEVPADQMVCCNRDGCISNQGITRTVITQDLVAQHPLQFLFALAMTFISLRLMRSVRAFRHAAVPRFDKNKEYTHQDEKHWALVFTSAIIRFVVATSILYYTTLLWKGVRQAYQFNSWDWLLLEWVSALSLSYQVIAGAWAVQTLSIDLTKVMYKSRLSEQHLHEIVDDKPQFPQKKLRASV